MNPRYYIQTAALAVAMLSLWGCARTGEFDVPGYESDKLSFQFTLPAGTVKTRSVPAENGENTVNDLTLFFFEPSANGTGKFLGYYAVPQEDIPAEDEMYGVMNNMFELQITLTSGHKLSASAAYSILVAANMQKNYFDDIETDLPGFILNIESMTLHDVMVYTMMRVEGVGVDQDNDNEFMSMFNLPMSAVCQKAEKVARVECELTRSVVRFDVVNKASGYRLVSASIWNAFPIGSLFDGVDIDYSLAPLQRYYGVKHPDGFSEIHGGLYSFENVSPNPDPKDEKTTCLIFGMAPESAPDNVSYYRVNISPKVTGQYLLRNNVYQVTISAVNKTGAGSEEDAYRDGEMNLDTSINSWDRDEDGLIMRDGDNLMALPTKRAVFGPEAEERLYYVYTLGEGILEMSHLSMPSGMNAWLGGKGNDLYVSVTSYSADERKGAIELRFAGMKAVMEIIQNGREKKILQLSYTNLPTWPAGTANVNAINGKPIIVESSGPWTAEIYNGNFSFDNNSTNITLQGNNGDGIYSVFNTSVNGNPENRHSFILVTLDADPDNYRNALVLTQLGIGGFTINPSTTHVNFNADGSLTAKSDNFNEFEVFPGNPTDTWTVSITDNQENPTTEFAYEYLSGNVQGNQVEGPGSFRVTSPGHNYDEDKEGILTVTHNGVNQKKIYLFKDSYDLKLSYYYLTLPAEGGTTQAVTVTSNMTGAKWSASISSNLGSEKGLIPYLVDENNNHVSSLTSLDAGKSFKVYMPGINQHLTPQEKPKTTVTVSLDGSTLTKELVVIQDMVIYDNIYAQTINKNLLASWCPSLNVNDNTKVFGRWLQEMTDPRYFGPGGTVYAKSVINTTLSDEKNILYPSTGVVKIINMNGNLPKNSWAQYRKTNPDAVFIVSSWFDDHSAFTNTLDLSGYYMRVYGQYTPIPNASTARVVYDADHLKQTEIWKYVCGGEGPFPVDYQNVKLYPQYWPIYQSVLESWPDTFIPLIMAPSGVNDDTPNPARVVVGVDPTNRIIWIGHKDLFGTDGSGAPSNWITNDDNLNFLRNLIAWMINVNNYGDAFNDRFKQDRSR